MACDVPGRDRDLVRLIDAYVAIAQGGAGGQTVFVAGDEGSGRTALLRALATELERIKPQPIVLAGAFRDGRFVAWSEEDVPVAATVDVVNNVVELAEALIPYAALVGQVLSKSQAAVELIRRLIGETSDSARRSSCPSSCASCACAVRSYASSTTPITGRPACGVTSCSGSRAV